MIELLFFLIFSSLIIFFSKKFNLLPNYTGDEHQKFLSQKKVPLIGGLLILFPTIYFFQNNVLLCITILIIFLIGISSDTRIINSPKKRIILQLILIICSILFLNIEISDTRIFILDYLLEIKLFNLFFCVFCIMILINGSNFIDGLNGLLLGYFLIILLILLDLGYLIDITNSQYLLLLLISGIVFLLILNLFNLLYLGDGGSYVIGFVLGYILIAVYNQNVISPFFIILLIWYPCFENLFSIIRKNSFKKSAINADNKHLHQLFFYFLNKKFIRSNLLSNNISSIIINIYNCIIIIIGSTDPKNTIFQILLIILNITVYFIIYRYLFIFRFRKIKK